MDAIRRLLRGLRHACWECRSQLVLAWYRSLYAGLDVGRGAQIGKGVHISVVRGAQLAIGENAAIESCVEIVVEGKLVIGANCFIGIGTVLVAAENMAIGDDCLIGAYATVRDQDHVIETRDVPYREQGRVCAPVSIGRNVWIGTKATILRGVTIGDNSVIGANSVVTRDIQANCVAAGIPAKVIRQFDEQGKP